MSEFAQLPPQQGNPSLGLDKKEVLEYVNDPHSQVPLVMRKLAWGYYSHVGGMIFLNEREARAQLYRVHEFALSLKRTVPARKIDDTFINYLYNFENACKQKIYQSTMRPKGFINERMADAVEVQDFNTPGRQQERKRIIPLPGSPI